MTNKPTLCTTHGWPIIQMEGASSQGICLHQVAQAYLLGRRIVDVVPGDAQEPYALVFHDGTVLPLYCPACGEPDHIEVETDRLLEMVEDLWLVAAYFVPRDGQSPDEVQLTFVDDPNQDPETLDESDRMVYPVHIKSLQYLRRPGVLPE